MNNFIKRAWSIPIPGLDISGGAEQLINMNPDSSLVDKILSSNTMKSLFRFGDFSDSVNLGDLHNVIGDNSGIPSTIGMMDNLETIVKNIDSSNIPDANHYAKIIELTKSLKGAAKDKLNDALSTADSIGSYLKNMLPSSSPSDSGSEEFIKQMMRNSSVDSATKQMTGLGKKIFNNIGGGDIKSFQGSEVFGPAGRSQTWIDYAKDVSKFQNAANSASDKMNDYAKSFINSYGGGDIFRVGSKASDIAFGPGNSEGLKAYRNYLASQQGGNGSLGTILKGLLGIGAAGTGLAAASSTPMVMEKYKHLMRDAAVGRQTQQAASMEMQNMAKQIADLQLSNQALQKSNQALQTSNSSLTANLPNRLKNMGQSIMDVIKNNPKTSIALGAGAAGLASLPLLMGSYENPMPKKKAVKKRRSVKTSELIMNMAREKVAAFDWNNPMLVAGVGGLTGAAAGAAEQYLFNPPEERNYTGALINGGAGGALGALAGKGAGLGGDLPSTLLHGGIFGGTLGLYTPDRTDMKFMTQRELQDMQRYLDSPDADPEMVPYVQAYMADQRREYGL